MSDPEPRPLPRRRPGRARAPRVAPRGDQRPQRLPGRRRRHGRQHGAHAARLRSTSSTAWPATGDRSIDEIGRDEIVDIGRPRGAARRARQQRRHPLPADPRRRRGARLAARRARRPGAARRGDGPRRPARLRLGPRAGRGHDADRHARHGGPGRPASSRTCRRRAWTPGAGDEEQNRALADVLERAIVAGEESVKRGPELLPVLQRGRASSTPAATASRSCSPASSRRCAATEPPELEHHRPPARVTHPEHVSSTYRYCTNFAVTGDGPGRRRTFVGALEAIGDSVLVVGDAHTLRVHVHTDEPERATRVFDGAGEVSRLDVADMHEQVAERAGRLAAGGAAPRPRCAAACWRSRAATACRELFAGLGAHVLDGGADAEPVDLRAARRHPRGRRRGGRRAAQQPERRHGGRARRRAVREGRPRRPDRARSRPGSPPRSRSTPSRSAAAERRRDARRARATCAPAASRPPRARTPQGRFAVGDAVGYVERGARRLGRARGRRCARCSTAWRDDAELVTVHRRRRRAARTTTRSPRSRPTASSSSLATAASRAGGGCWPPSERPTRARGARAGVVADARSPAATSPGARRCSPRPCAGRGPRALEAPLAVEPGQGARGRREALGLHTVGDLLEHLPRDRREARTVGGARARRAGDGRRRGPLDRLAPGAPARDEAARRGRRRRRERDDEGRRSSTSRGSCASTRRARGWCCTARTRPATASASPSHAPTTEAASARRRPRSPTTRRPRGSPRRRSSRWCGSTAPRSRDALEPLPGPAARSPSGLPDRPAALLAAAHAGDLEGGRRRLAFDELLLVQLDLLRRRAHRRATPRRAARSTAPTMTLDARAGWTSCCRSRRPATSGARSTRSTPTSPREPADAAAADGRGRLGQDGRRAGRDAARRRARAGRPR